MTPNHKPFTMWIITFLLCFSMLSGQRTDQFTGLISIIEKPLNPLLPEESVQAKLMPFLENLDDGLLPFSEYGCFIHITSFQTAPCNFQVSRFPHVLRHLSSRKLIIYAKPEDGIWDPQEVREKWIWKMKGARLQFGNATSNCFFDTPFIDIGDATPDYFAGCIKLNYFNFIQKSRPWRCEAHLQIFPPTIALLTDYFNIDNHLVHLGVWHYDKEINPWSLPGVMTKFNAIFVTSDMHKMYLYGAPYRDWVGRHIPSSYNYVVQDQPGVLKLSTDIFFIFQTSRTIRSLEQVADTIRGIWSFKHCLSCDFEAPNPARCS